MRTSPAALRISEAHIESTCSAFLALDGWRKLKTDPVSRREHGKGFGELGMADCLYIRYGLISPHPVRGPADCFWGNALACSEVIWIEWKRIKPGGYEATKALPHQLEWHRAEKARGALTLIAGVDFPATIEGFQDWYRKSGLNQRLKH